MQNFKILKKSEFKKSFRDKVIIDSFSIKENHLEKIFEGNIDLDFDWNIGLIVGNSGTGKTTISNQLFENDIDLYDNEKSVINNFPENSDTKEIMETLSKMGLNSPPLWLQTFDTLSNGEKMRALLALNLFKKNFFVFDEFTSVVDRDIAKITSHVVKKYVVEKNKKFVAISCHYDIIEWLQPDWIFDTNKMIFEKKRYLQQRPEIKIKIYKSREFWNIFKRYHYLNESLANSAEQYIGVINNKPCLFCAVMHFPKKYKTNEPHIYRVTRLVCVPDFQGVGAGIHFLNEIGKIYLLQNKRFSISTSNYSIIKNLYKDKKWICTQSGHRAPHQSKSGAKKLKNTNSGARYLYSFEMIKC